MSGLGDLGDVEAKRKRGLVLEVGYFRKPWIVPSPHVVGRQIVRKDVAEILEVAIAGGRQ